MTVLHVHPANAILFSTLMASTRVAPPMMALSSRQSPKVILGMLTDTVGGMLSDDLSSSLAADEETFVVDQLPAPLERIALSADSDAAQKWARAAEEDACALLGAAGLDDGEQLSLTLTDDPAIRELNAQWRAVDAPTDVLSFPMDDPQLLGDLVISIDTAGRQAKERSHSIRDELRVRAEENHEPSALLSFSHAIYSFPFDSLADLDGPRRAPPARLRPRDVKRRAYRDGRRRAEAAHKARVEWCRVNRPCRGAGGGGVSHSAAVCCCVHLCLFWRGGERRHAPFFSRLYLRRESENAWRRVLSPCA